ncbi:MAG: single-stranded DNA-binding protein [Ruminococcaceae bacterium]|nr:single-stranded DNA-binding protein [Oscillospiraceae bacterium]
MSFNKVILIGNMTADPELKQTQSGVSVCSFSIAVNRRFTKDGEQNVDFINIVAWRQQAEFVTKYFRKGKPILVCGQLQTRSWTDNQGNKRYATEVVADEVAFAGENQGNTEQKNEPVVSTPSSYVPSAYTQPGFANTSPKFEEIPGDDGLPF